MASALRSSILRHIRVPISLNGPRLLSVRSMSSSHDDHLEKKEVVDRVLDVIKSFPKVDPSKVYSLTSLDSPPIFLIYIYHYKSIYV